ncbi:ethanolamine kinase 1 isoform X1 [Palaemon carinicauda]|uniref:ethanolamine kinase 1 isoform X1 n=2 Tax=Palaemon carinicauda TaxID=392227 RepID=UPI0035B594C8
MKICHVFLRSTIRTLQSCRMVANLDLVVDGSSIKGLKSGAREIVRHIRPNWKENDLQFKVYTDGITNQLIGVWHEDQNDQILVRVYGNKTELFIDRNLEKKNVQILNKAGCSPPLYASFTNGLSYGFTKGVTTTTATITEDPIWQAVARELAKLHKIEEGDRENPMLFPKMKQFFDLLPSKFEDQSKQKRIEESGYTKDKLAQEIEELESHLTSLKCPVVFSHNDILLGNVIWDAMQQKASFIDYEYGACNYQPYDIANHFNEFAGVDEVDYSRYPSKDFQKSWLRCYLSHYKGISSSAVDAQELEIWYVWVNKFSLASHVFWGVWALLQAYHSSIDFDFIGYGITRLNEYSNKKKEYFHLKC